MASILRVPAQFDPRHAGPDRFAELIKTVPWMSNVGKSHRSDRQTLRIHRWEDVPYLDQRGAMSLFTEHSEWWSPAAVGTSIPFPEQSQPSSNWLGDRMTAKVAAFGDEINRIVLNLACEAVGCDHERDFDYPPNVAAGSAGWVAASIGLCLKAGVEIPRNALRQWVWYVRGHWPCAYEDGVEIPVHDVPGIPRCEARLVVF